MEIQPRRGRFVKCLIDLTVLLLVGYMILPKLAVGVPFLYSDGAFDIEKAKSVAGVAKMAAIFGAVLWCALLSLRFLRSNNLRWTLSDDGVDIARAGLTIQSIRFEEIESIKPSKHALIIATKDPRRRHTIRFLNSEEQNRFLGEFQNGVDKSNQGFLDLTLTSQFTFPKALKAILLLSVFVSFLILFSAWTIIGDGYLKSNGGIPLKESKEAIRTTWHLGAISSFVPVVGFVLFHWWINRRKEWILHERSIEIHAREPSPLIVDFDNVESLLYRKGTLRIFTKDTVFGHSIVGSTPAKRCQFLYEFRKRFELWKNA